MHWESKRWKMEISSSSTKNAQSLKTLAPQVILLFYQVRKCDDKLRKVCTRWETFWFFMNTLWVTDKLTGPDRSKQRDSQCHLMNKTWCESRRRNEKGGESHQGRCSRWLKLDCYFQINSSVTATVTCWQCRDTQQWTDKYEWDTQSKTHTPNRCSKSLCPPPACKFTTSHCTSSTGPPACPVRYRSVIWLDP